jgi:hypothetical protein
MRAARKIRSAGLVAISLLITGCNAEQLRFTTLRLSQSIPDLQEKQVIDNFARIAANPGSVPYYVVINSGIANIQDAGSGGLAALTFQPHFDTVTTLNATASRSVTGNWTLNPMSNPDRLRAMRAAYHIALGAEFIDSLDKARLDAILEDQKGLVVPSGWLGVGTKHDVPHEVRMHSHCGKTYVWVTPEHAKDFADFSLLMLNIATWVPPSSPPSLSLSIDKIAPLQIGKAPSPTAQAQRPVPQGTAPPEVARPPAPEAHPIQRRLYEDSQSINRGLFFVPR